MTTTAKSLSRSQKWIAGIVGVGLLALIGNLTGTDTTPDNTASAAAVTAEQAEQDRQADQRWAESGYIAILETQVGLDFFEPYDRDKLLQLGYEACDDLQAMPVVDDAHVMPQAAAMMDETPFLGIDATLHMYAAAAVELCPTVR